MCLLILLIVSAPIIYTLVGFVCMLNNNNYHIQGPPDYVFHLEADQKDNTKIAIYTKYDTRYYLEPSDDDTHKIIAVPEDKRKYTYPFKFPA